MYRQPGRLKHYIELIVDIREQQLNDVICLFDKSIKYTV